MEISNAELSELADTLTGVEAAMERLDDGTYGVCASCGESIEDSVLIDHPTATTCAAHAGDASLR